MKLRLIAAVSIDGAIGNDNELLWHISDDLKRFKEKTLGNVVIIGRKTYDSLPDAAKKGRDYVVVTTSTKPLSEGTPYSVSNSIAHAIILAKELAKTDKHIYVAGGETIYNEMIDLCDEAEITWVDKIYSKANKRFPIDKLFNEFYISGDQSWYKENGLRFKYTTYERE